MILRALLGLVVVVLVLAAVKYFLGSRRGH